MDVLSVYGAAKEAVDRARRGEGPSLIECKTYRFLGHSRGDPPYGPYRTKEELDSWKKRDPRLLLIEQGGLSPEEVERIDQEVAGVIDEAIRYADASPQPDIKVALEDVYI
jgi:TPP-dependent pyruvate/acetoin dehydrogenase alpha subunit